MARRDERVRVHVPRIKKKKRPAHRKWDPVARNVIFSDKPIILVAGVQESITSDPEAQSKVENQTQELGPKFGPLNLESVAQGVPKHYLASKAEGYKLHLIYYDPRVQEFGSWKTTKPRSYGSDKNALRYLRKLAEKESDAQADEQTIGVVTLGKRIVGYFIFSE